MGEFTCLFTFLLPLQRFPNLSECYLLEEYIFNIIRPWNLYIQDNPSFISFPKFFHNSVWGPMGLSDFEIWNFNQHKSNFCTFWSSREVLQPFQLIDCVLINWMIDLIHCCDLRPWYHKLSINQQVDDISWLVSQLKQKLLF